MVAALMVLIQEPRPRGRRVAIWALLIFALPILGPATYLIVETIRYRRQHGRPEKGLVEKYAPEEAAQRRAQARREAARPEGSYFEEGRSEEDRRARERGDDRGAAAD
nr:PLD nuclease N-terminal domain-containing protein [Nesterenkonia sandarakina]